MTQECMDLGSTTPIEVHTKIDGLDYILREASGDAVCRYQDAQLSGTTLADGKPVKMVGLAATDPFLVSLCLFILTKDGVPANTPVSLDRIKSWPNRIQKALAAKVKEISGLDKVDEEQDETVKNS